MPQACCVPYCKNRRDGEIALFLFSLKRKELLKKWLENIGKKDFMPKKSDLICSIHFTVQDFMVRPNKSDVRLNFNAVPSIFPKRISCASEKKLNICTLWGPDNVLQLYRSKRKTFIIGFAAAVKSIIATARDLLSTPNWKYLMTYRFSQDYLELFFA